MGLFGGGLGTVLGGAGGFMLGGPAGGMLGMQLGGALDSGAASRDAAREGSRAAMAGVNLQREMWEQGREDTSPWREFSQRQLPGYGSAISGLSDYSFDFDPSQVENTPGYQFRLEQGSENMMRGMRASGMRQSGGMAVDMMNYGQNYASQEYMNEYQRQLETSMANYGFRADDVNRRSTAAGMGSSAATAGMQAGVSAGAYMASGMNVAGGYNAAGIMGQNNAWTNAINSGMQFAGNSGMFGSQTPGGVGTPPYFPPSGGYGQGMWT